MENFNHQIPIVTPRLRLRPPTLDDLIVVHRSMNNVWGELQKWMSWAYDGEETLQATENYIRSRMDYQAAPGIGLLGFDYQGNFVVSSGLAAIADRPDEYETGYWVDRAYLGQGYATEATNAVIRYAFGHLNAKAIEINYFDTNEKSRRIIEKLHFDYVRTDKAIHKRCSDGAMVDSHVFLLKDPSKLPPLDVKWG